MWYEKQYTLQPFQGILKKKKLHLLQNYCNCI
jgi:hypothetical protein